MALATGLWIFLGGESEIYSNPQQQQDDDRPRARFGSILRVTKFIRSKIYIMAIINLPLPCTPRLPLMGTSAEERKKKAENRQRVINFGVIRFERIGEKKVRVIISLHHCATLATCCSSDPRGRWKTPQKTRWTRSVKTNLITKSVASHYRHGLMTGGVSFELCFFLLLGTLGSIDILCSPTSL